MDKYNLETRDAIKNFIDDFMEIFPGLKIGEVAPVR